MRVITCLLAVKASPGAFADRNTPARSENQADCAFASRTAWRRAACRRGFIVGVVVAACLVTTASLAQSPVNIFGNAVPPNPAEADPNAVTLGVKFWSTLPGTITGISETGGNVSISNTGKLETTASSGTDISDLGPEIKRGGDYPQAWTRTDGRGRIFYTALGHRDDVWSNDPVFRAHVTGGIRWALGLETER